MNSDGSGIYSLEKVVQDNPQVIIISGMGIGTDKEKDMWNKYTTISAVKNRRIFTIDSDELCSPNPVTFPQVLKKIAGILHPALKF